MILLTEEYPVKYLNTEVLIIEVNRFFKKKRGTARCTLRCFRESVAIDAHRAWSPVLHR